jgi:hypothetical protein
MQRQHEGAVLFISIGYGIQPWDTPGDLVRIDVFFSRRIDHEMSKKSQSLCMCPTEYEDREGLGCWVEGLVVKPVHGQSRKARYFNACRELSSRN